MTQEHFFTASDGALHDTRVANWASTPLRPNYSRTHQHIKTVADFKATLRNGEFAWPGGYPMYLITNDGGALHFDCARENAYQVMWEMANECNGGWRVIACDINYEDGDCYCDHCGERIESAYAG